MDTAVRAAPRLQYLAGSLKPDQRGTEARERRPFAIGESLEELLGGEHRLGLLVEGADDPLNQGSGLRHIRSRKQCIKLPFSVS